MLKGPAARWELVCNTALGRLLDGCLLELGCHGGLVVM